MSIERTLNRLLAGLTNVLVNPYFEWILWDDNFDYADSRNDGNWWLPTPARRVFRVAPGWYVFGHYDLDQIPDIGGVPPIAKPRGGRVHGEVQRDLASPSVRFDEGAQGAGTETLERNATINERVASGVAITQRQGKIFGLVQEIDGYSLRGRTVRLTGTVKRPGFGGDPLSGVSIWVKSKVSQQAITTGQTDSGANMTRLTNSSVEALGQNFLTTVTAGDTLWIDGIGIFRINTVASNEILLLDVGEETGGVLPLAWGSRDFEVVAVGQQADTHAVVLPGNAMHVVQWVAGGSTFYEGLIIHNRAWDFLTPNKVSGVPGAPESTWYRLSREAQTGDATFARQADGIPYKTPGRIYYLDDTFTNDGVNDVRLYTHQVPSNERHSFDITVKLPALDPGNEAAGDVGTMYLVVMAVDPTQVGSMASDAEIELETLTLSVVGDEGNAVVLNTGLETRALHDAIYPLARRSAYGAFSGTPGRRMLRYPIYQPFIVPLDFSQLKKYDKTGDVPSAFLYDHQFTHEQHHIGWQEDSGNPFPASGVSWWAPQYAYIPPLACIVEMGFEVVDKDDITGSTVLRMFETKDSSYGTPLWDSNPNGGRGGRMDPIAVWTIGAVATNPAGDMWRPHDAGGRVARNRKGMTLAINSIYEDDAGHYVPSTYTLELITPTHNAVGTARLTFGQGYIYGVYDPRTGPGFFRNFGEGRT